MILQSMTFCPICHKYSITPCLSSSLYLSLLSLRNITLSLRYFLNTQFLYIYCSTLTALLSDLLKSTTSLLSTRQILLFLWYISLTVNSKLYAISLAIYSPLLYSLLREIVIFSWCIYCTADFKILKILNKQYKYIQTLLFSTMHTLIATCIKCSFHGNKLQYSFNLFQ